MKILKNIFSKKRKRENKNSVKKYKLIKITTYNINVTSDLGSEYKIKNVIKHVYDKMDRNNDIICIQGIKNDIVGYKLLKYFSNTFGNYKYHTCPKLVPSKNIVNLHKNDQNRNYLNYNAVVDHYCDDNILKATTNNIILSKFPIIDTMYATFDPKKSSNLDNRSIVCADINVYGHVIRIFNTQLTSDNHYISNNNRHIRKKEFDRLFHVINKTKTLMKSKNKINTFVAGPLYMSDKQTINSHISEYEKRITKYNIHDIYFILNGEKSESHNFVGYILDLNTGNQFINKNIVDDIKTNDGIFLHNCIDKYDDNLEDKTYIKIKFIVKKIYDY